MATFAVYPHNRTRLPTLLQHPARPLAPAELDDYLTAGWRPTGQALYNSDYLRTDTDALYGCLQLRIPLADFTFKKRHRKLLRRNAALFRTEVGPATLPTPAHLEVNRLYREKHAEKSQENLGYHVVGEQLARRLDTWETRVYLRDRLVAFSYFDRGKDCLYAKTGIYDPAFADYSLGVYTMLLELQFAVDNGFLYYHPGYYAPAYPAFNYKLGFGPTEYRDPATGSWQLLEGDPEDHPADPYRQTESKLLTLLALLAIDNVVTTLTEYPSFTARYYYVNQGMDPELLLDGALLLHLGTTSVSTDLIITYDLAQGKYVCYEVGWAMMQDFKLLSHSPVNGLPRLPHPVRIVRELTGGADVVAFVPELIRRLRTPGR